MKVTISEAKTRLSELVKKARHGEKIVLTSGRKKIPVAMIVPIKPLKKRPMGMFASPGFHIPDDFDELPEAELKLWLGE